MNKTMKKSVLASAVLLSLSSNITLANAQCGDPTLPRQGEVSANQTHCITNYGHYFYVEVPYENSQLVISTSGGTYNGIDAAISLYEGNHWSGTVTQRSDTADTNTEQVSETSRAGRRYFKIDGNIAQTTLRVDITGGDIPPPLGDYIIYNTNISVNLPNPAISSKSQYGSIIPTILAAKYADFEALAGAANDPLPDVLEAIHYLADADDIADPDLNQLLYFLGSYKFYAQAITTTEASNLNTAMQAVAKMTAFLSPTGSVIQEGYAKAINNFQRGNGANHFKDQLPHILAAIQYHSLQTDPFKANNASDAMMEMLGAVANAAMYGDPAAQNAINERILDVMSVIRSFAVLGETAIDLRWSKESDRKWIVPHSYIALGKIATIATDEAKARFDSIVLETHEKLIAWLSTETIETMTTKKYLDSAKRLCESTDPLFGHCIVPPKESDILTVTHKCSDSVTIRAQSTISQSILNKSCAEMATQETEFHAFFNTQGSPVANDKNTTLEVVVFSSPDEYKKYAPEFFDNVDTDNGGIYLEGTPEKEGNQARFLAMQCPDAWVGKSCQYEDQIYNLRHEYVHYLDGRYVKVGGFNYYNYNVSWSEGMAEYLANGTDFARTLESIKGKVIPPLYNLLFMAYGYDDLYQWSYFAMRYLDEQHNSDMHLLKDALRNGSKDGYVSSLKAVAQRSQADFEAFVMANSEAIAAKAEVIPNAGKIGSCDLTQQYVRPVDANNTDYTITNNTDTPVSIFWIDNQKGTANFAKNYKTLGQGDTYNATNWREFDRIMLSDNNLNCLGVASLKSAGNTFTINADLVKDVVPETLPAQHTLGSCELVKPHIIGDEAHQFSITNTTDYPVRLFRIDNLTGKPKYESAADGFDYGYGTLQKGQSYTSDIWYANRRFMITDARLNCLSVGVLDNPTGNFTIDEAMVANAKSPEVLPAANQLGSCDLMEKHLTGPFEADFKFTNTTDTTVRIYRVDNETGALSDSFEFKTLAQGETYSSADSWKWFGNRRAAITTQSGQCLAVAVMSEENTLNDYVITNDILDNGNGNNNDADGDGVIDSEDAFPNDPTETKDTDGDGFGDNKDAFPNDSSEWLDSDGDGMGDNSDPFPNDPNNGAIQDCGAATINYGQLTLGKNECVAGGRNSFYVWVAADNTTLTLQSQGGEGDVGIYFNADTWASKANAQNKSGEAGTAQSLVVTANRGWRYITLNTNSTFKGVTFSVKAE